MKITYIQLPLTVDTDNRIPFRDAWHGYSVDTDDGNWIALCHDAEQAQLIADCVNSHADLILALQNIMTAKWRPESMSEELADAARAALAKAGAV